MANKKVLDYINKGLGSGYKPDDLKAALLKGGWEEPVVNEAMKEAQSTSKKRGEEEKKRKEDEKRRQKEDEKRKKKEDEKKRKEEEKRAKEAGKKKKEEDRHKKEGEDKKKEAAGKEDAKDKKKEDTKKDKQGKKEKKGREKPVPIVYKKPAGKLTTEVDDMLETISDRKKIRVNQLAKLMKVDENEIKEWAETLENWGIIEIHYPLFGKPVLTMARKKPKKEEEEEA